MTAPEADKVKWRLQDFRDSAKEARSVLDAGINRRRSSKYWHDTSVKAEAHAAVSKACQARSIDSALLTYRQALDTLLALMADRIADEGGRGSAECLRRLADTWQELMEGLDADRSHEAAKLRAEFQHLADGQEFDLAGLHATTARHLERGGWINDTDAPDYEV